MWRRESVNIVTCILMVCAAVLHGAQAGRTSGVDLQFSLQPEPVTVSVSGKVTDKRTGEPIASALVRGHVLLWKYQGPELDERAAYLETRTDANGLYALEFVTTLTESGPMKGQDGLCVYVSAPGYETLPQYAGQDVTAQNTAYEDFDFALDEGQRIAGVVVDEQMHPVADAVVRLQGGENGDWDFFGSTGRTVTDAAGKFELWISKGRGRWLNIMKQGYGASFFWDYLEKSDMGTLTLTRGGSIKDRILGPDGKGVANCEVSVRRFPCWLIDKTFTDSRGNYTLNGVPGDPSIIEFLKRKNGSCTAEEAQCEVYTRLNPEAPLSSIPTYTILAKEGQTIAGPNLNVSGGIRIRGQLVAMNHNYSLGGLLVQLDGSWGSMVECDADGRFTFPSVPPGKHRLTAYLPHNLRYDRGIGQTEIVAEPGKSLEGVQVELADLAELRVQYLDAEGNPLEGVVAGATWSQSGDGGWTQGTNSDNDGWAVLYLYPDEVQYVRGFDFSGRSGALVAETPERIRPKPGQILDSVRIVMLPSAQLRGRLVDDKGAPLVGKEVLCKLVFADGVQGQQAIRTDSEGRFRLDRLTPGFVTLSIHVDSVLRENVAAAPVELRSGESRDLGDVMLKGGMDSK
jgi:hypothetical protein